MIWKVCIRTANGAQGPRKGLVRAASKEEAVELAGDPFALAWPLPETAWPGVPEERVCWSN